MRRAAMLLAFLGLPLNAQEVSKPAEKRDPPALESGPDRPAQALLLFVAGLKSPAANPDNRERLAKELGLVLKDGMLGSEEGHLLNDLQYWMSWEDYDLAEAAYRISGRRINSPTLRFVRSWNLLRWAVVKKDGFSRALAALEEIQASDRDLRDHVAALVKSLRAAMPCVHCDGKGRIRCTRCHGVGAIAAAGGSEKTPCGSCEKGHLKCSQCAGPRAAPALEDICTAARCASCEGRGLMFKTVRWPCTECRGLGRKLVPKADPDKALP